MPNLTEKDFDHKSKKKLLDSYRNRVLLKYGVAILVYAIGWVIFKMLRLWD